MTVETALAGLANRLNQALALPWLALTLLCSCSRPVPSGSFVLTQSPSATFPRHRANDTLDVRYPAGTRVLVADAKFKQFRILSEGLFAAGDPQVSYDGQFVLFCGKARAEEDWQIYEVKLASGTRRVLTSMHGGAMSPVLLPRGDLIFVSPVPKPNSSNAPGALYVTSPGAQPRRLTFTPAALSDLTVLSDGRILFVSHGPCGPANGSAGYSLLTINNDGTEISEFASLPDRTQPLRRPRQLPDGRIVFLVSRTGSGHSREEAEFVRSARPFSGSEPLLTNGASQIFSVQAVRDRDLLVCAKGSSSASRSPQGFALYRLEAATAALGEPLFYDSAWNNVEAVELSSHPRPMGRLSNVDLTKKTGQLLCLNANFTTYRPTGGSSIPQATRVRVLAGRAGGDVRVLGDIPLQADGSFMAEVPADVPLGFELFDNQGQLLRRLEPTIWVRPDENRSCIGCHEPRNQAPRNFRPLAVRVPVPRLSLDGPSLAQTKR